MIPLLTLLNLIILQVYTNLSINQTESTRYHPEIGWYLVLLFHYINISKINTTRSPSNELVNSKMPQVLNVSLMVILKYSLIN